MSFESVEMIRNIICCKSEGKYTDYCNNNPDNYNCGMTGQCKPNCTIIRQLCMIVRIMRIRLGNKGGTRETSSQKQFGLAESFFWLCVNHKTATHFCNICKKGFFLYKTYQFL